MSKNTTSLSTAYQEKISQVIKLLKAAKSILFITGAGISADSGLPTYRGIGGLYNQDATEDGMPIEAVLSGETLRRKPEITWRCISGLEQRCRGAVFNRGHQIIAEMERRFERVWVLTQNIDGFHQAAGSRNVIDIHGDIHKLVCTRCAWRKAVKDYRQLDIPPHCPQCNQVLRPEVVLFGELLPLEKLQLLERELQKGFDLYFSIGTTSVFSYIQQPILQARHLGRPTIEINPLDSQISDWVDIKLALGAAQALELIWNQYLNSAR